MTREKMFIANWKMHKCRKEAKVFVKEFIDAPAAGPVYIAPSYTVISAITGHSHIHIGAQNLSHEKEGALTGEVSADMLCDVGAKFVLIGHSERRSLFNEGDKLLHAKLKMALSHKLLPILCIGESAAQRESGQTHKVLTEQLYGSLEGLTFDKIVIAYEPVWAIGTGISATPEMAQETHKEVRRILGELFSEKVARATSILYGGSVKPDNIAQLISQPDIDGALIGGASLKTDSYREILKQGYQS